MSLAQAEYMELVEDFPLCEIRNGRELDRAMGVIDRLLSLPKLTRDAQRYLDALAILVEHYESTRFGTWDASQPEILGHLLESHGVQAADVARATGVSSAKISSALKGTRELDPASMRALAKYFSVDPGVFL